MFDWIDWSFVCERVPVVDTACSLSLPAAVCRMVDIPGLAYRRLSWKLDIKWILLLLKQQMMVVQWKLKDSYRSQSLTVSFDKKNRTLADFPGMFTGTLANETIFENSGDGSFDILMRLYIPVVLTTVAVMKRDETEIKHNSSITIFSIHCYNQFWSATPCLFLNLDFKNFIHSGFHWTLIRPAAGASELTTIWCYINLLLLLLLLLLLILRLHCYLCVVLQQVAKDTKKPPAPCSSKSFTALPSYPLNCVLFPSGVDVEIDLDEMMGPQNILEEHVSRVWEDQAAAENDHVGISRSASARLPAKPFHGRSLQPVHPSPDVSTSALGYSFGRCGSRHSASFCQPDFDASCCSEMDHSADRDQRLAGLPDGVSSIPHHRLIHSTPKSKSHFPSKYTTSQSDSEMWDDCGSSVEQKSGVWLWGTSTECASCGTSKPHYSSQPNLPAALAHSE